MSEEIRYEHVPPVLKLVARCKFTQDGQRDVRYSFRSNDEEVAKYAKMNNCLALISEDSDFLIFDCTDNYLSAKYLNLDTLTTKCYNRQALMNHLGLTQAQLPLFSTLAGNEFVPGFELRNFHKFLCGYQQVSNYTGTILERTAKFVKNLPEPVDLVQLSHKICRSDKLVEKLQESINVISYNYKPEETECTGEWGDVLNEAYLRHRTAQVPPCVYNVLSTNRFFGNNVFEDFRNRNIPPISKVLRPLRQNIYGILLYDERNVGGSHTVEEYSIEGQRHKSNDYAIFPTKVTASKPVAQHPGLLQLWGDQDSETIAMKWKLFSTSISLKLKVWELQDIKPQLILLTSALFYLYSTTNILNKNDVFAFVKQAIQVKNTPIETLSNIRFNKINLHAVQLAAKVLQTIVELEFLNAACGKVISTQDCCVTNYFDGKLFQKIYIEVEALGECLLDDLDEIERSDFKQITGLIFQKQI